MNLLMKFAQARRLLSEDEPTRLIEERLLARIDQAIRLDAGASAGVKAVDGNIVMIALAMVDTGMFDDLVFARDDGPAGKGELPRFDDLKPFDVSDWIQRKRAEGLTIGRST